MDNIKIKWFEGFTDSKETLKSRYRELVKQYHPDAIGKDNIEIREINTEYDMLYDSLLGGDTITAARRKANVKPTALINYHIWLFIRDRKNGGFVHIERLREIWSYFGYHSQFHTTAISVKDPPESMRPGFHVCEVVTDNPSEFYTYETYSDSCYARIIPDKTFEPADLDDMFELICAGNGSGPWSWYHNTESGFLPLIEYRPKQNASYTTRLHEASEDQIISVADSKNFGQIVYRKHDNPDMIVAYFKLDGVIYESPLIKKHLGPLENVVEYSPYDIVMLKRFGYSVDQLFENVDFEIPNVAARLGFTLKDKVLDWPLNPVLSRYVRLRIISVYRHNHQMIGHFNNRQLAAAIINKKIDLEDFDLCQKKFDEWYNDCLAKFKRDVKKGRIRITN